MQVGGRDDDSIDEMLEQVGCITVGIAVGHDTLVDLKNMDESPGKLETDQVVEHERRCASAAECDHKDASEGDGGPSAGGDDLGGSRRKSPGVGRDLDI
jgi:hypothetical protein